MKKLLFLIALIALPASAQKLDEMSFEQSFLLRNAAGTAANPGPQPNHAVFFTNGAWTSFLDGDVHVTYVSESGPEVQRNEVFSTNWVTAGVQRTLGSRGLILLRGRASLEPYTMDENGYPQMLQVISGEAGGPQIDRMRAHDLIGELAADLAFRTTASSYFHVYAAPVGDPALGAVPFAQRASSREFAEAPFSYDVAEPTHDSTSVVTAGWSSTIATIEASVFHDAVTTGRHDEIDTGDIDSRAFRLTITPGRNLSIQASRGELGDAKLAMTTASVSYGTPNVAVTGLWSRREVQPDVDFDAFSLEGTFRAARNTIMARIETVDRPAGLFADVPGPASDSEGTTHFTVGYIFDVLARDIWRGGLGVDIDYHTQTHELSDRYGHKPQAIYLFARFRTE